MYSLSGKYVHNLQLFRLLFFALAELSMDVCECEREWIKVYLLRFSRRAALRELRGGIFMGNVFELLPTSGKTT